MDIIAKIKAAKIVGRGGAGFPTALKWESVYKAPGKIKYIVINAAEGEPGVKKDGYILDNYIKEMLLGVRLARKYLGAKMCYLYINPVYYQKNHLAISKAVKASGMEKYFAFFVKPQGAGYIGGEETAVINAISGFKIEPRLKPPYPTTSGLWEAPTLIDNVETFYDVALVAQGKYQGERFYTISGPIAHPGVYSFPADWTMEKILYESGNYPKFPFFVQVGGDASGTVLNQDQLGVAATGAASITIHNLAKQQPKKLLQSWVKFMQENSCGQCTPCREGTYRLVEILKAKTIDWNLVSNLLADLSETSFCALGGSVAIPIKSYIKNVLNNNLKVIS